MNFWKIICQFLLCWLVFMVVGILLSYLQQKLETFHFLTWVNNYLFAIIAYSLIFTFVIKFKNINFQQPHIKFNFFIAFGACLVLALGLQLFNQAFIDLYYYFIKPEVIDYVYITTPKSNVKFWITSMSAILFSPIFEEILFRGYFFKKLAMIKQPIVAAIITSALFSLVHLPYVGKLVPSFVLGLMLCYVYFKTKSIVLPIVLHSINNALAITSDFYLPHIWRPIFDLKFDGVYWSIITIGVVIIGIGIGMFDKVTRQKNPRENL